MKKKELVNVGNFEFWRYLINSWTILFFVVIICDFVVANALVEILDMISVIYVAILAIYVSNKEFERWYNRHHRQHPGEVFVIFWSILIFVLIIFNFINHGVYHIPGSIISSYIAVLTILAVTRRSKMAYQDKYQKK